MFTLLAAAAAALAIAAPAPTAEPMVIASFDGANPKTTFNWMAENDPVMGGQSVSTFEDDKQAGRGIWSGQVKIVPFLHAPGFCTCRTVSATVPDLSQYIDGGIVLEVMTTAKTNLTKFQFQFHSTENGGNPKKGGFEGGFTLSPGSSNYQQVYIPFASFTQSWRGEPEGGAPSASQLGGVVQLGIGADGVAGKFDMMIKSISVAAAAPGPAPGPPPPAPTDLIVLADFQAGSKTLYHWTDLNDPVMGGRSTSTFVYAGREVGTFNGTVAIVPQLKAPGFCNAEGRAGFGQKMPDASAALSGGLVYRVRSNGALSSFKASFGNRAQFNFGSYKADFDVPNDGEVHDIRIPFSKFSNKWSSATGEPTTKCSDDKRVCPTAQALSTLGSIGVWAEGKAGDFHLEIIWIAAYPASA